MCKLNKCFSNIYLYGFFSCETWQFAKYLPTSPDNLDIFENFLKTLIDKTAKFNLLVKNFITNKDKYLRRASSSSIPQLKYLLLKINFKEIFKKLTLKIIWLFLSNLNPFIAKNWLLVKAFTPPKYFSLKNPSVLKFFLNEINEEKHELTFKKNAFYKSSN